MPNTGPLDFQRKLMKFGLSLTKVKERHCRNCTTATAAATAATAAAAAATIYFFLFCKKKIADNLPQL